MKKKYCPYCGTELVVDALFCKKCGAKQKNVESTPMVQKEDEKPVALNENDKPAKKKKSKWRIALQAFGVMFLIGLCSQMANTKGSSSETSEDGYFSSLSAPENSSSSSSYNNGGSRSQSNKNSSSSSFVYKPFTTETSVRLYLTSNTFRSELGDVIRFEDMGNQIYLNGKLCSSAIIINRIQSDGAYFKYYGPYGDGSFVITNEAYGGGIMDLNDRTLYLIEK